MKSPSHYEVLLQIKIYIDWIPKTCLKKEVKKQEKKNGLYEAPLNLYSNHNFL